MFENYTKNNYTYETPNYPHTIKSTSIDPFPPINDSWFVNGLPDILNSQNNPLAGNLIDYVPLDIVANITQNNVSYGIIKTEANKFSGYLDMSGTYHPIASGEIFNGNIYPGLKIATLFANKDSFEYLEGSKVQGKGKWVLLSDFGGIEAGSTASKSISYKTGVNTTNAQSLSFTVGAKVGGTLEGMTGELSASLTQSFSTSISITEETTITDTVNFQAQDREQRIGAYQFYRDYYVLPGDGLRNLMNDQKNRNAAFVTEINRSFPYKTNHFQKVFVLAPNNSVSII